MIYISKRNASLGFAAALAAAILFLNPAATADNRYRHHGLACGSTPSGSTTSVVTTSIGSIAATTAQCPYGGTVMTTTNTTQLELCTNGVLSNDGSPTSTTTDGSPSCNAAPATNGQCGPINGATTNAAPTTGLCNAGTASAVSLSGAEWTWTCSAATVVACEAQDVVSKCPYGTAVQDGCVNAPAGTPEYPNLLDTQKVVMLNIIPGSGYTNGTFNWTSSGGGCTTPASGTVTVTNGQVGSSSSLGYTIANEGAGCASRPTINVSGLTGGSGFSVTSSVYQATPHNASTPWNMPGVDYYVGIPEGTVLKDPTVAGNLPAGATLSGSTVKITGCNVTLDGLDFTLHNTVVSVNVTGSNCVTTIQDSNFHANRSALQTIANLSSLGLGGSFVFQRNEYDGLAPNGGSGSGFAVNDPIQGSGNISLLYNYFHNFDSKVIQVNGAAAGSSLTEQYNLFADFGSCAGGCSHGEAEYTYGGGKLSMTPEFNTYVLHFHNKGSDLTSPHATQADDVTISNVNDDHNVLFAPGPGLTCNQYNDAYTAAALVFDGQQEGGAISNGTYTDNYLDNGGTYFPWYHNGGTNMSYTNNIDAGSAGPCNCTRISGNGSCN